MTQQAIIDAWADEATSAVEREVIAEIKKTLRQLTTSKNPKKYGPMLVVLGHNLAEARINAGKTWMGEAVAQHLAANTAHASGPGKGFSSDKERWTLVSYWSKKLKEEMAKGRSRTAALRLIAENAERRNWRTIDRHLREYDEIRALFPLTVSRVVTD